MYDVYMRFLLKGLYVEVARMWFSTVIIFGLLVGSLEFIQVKCRCRFGDLLVIQW